MKFNKKQFEALRLVSLDKVKFAGKGKLGEFYDVCRGAYNSISVILENDKYRCTCRDCVVKQIPNDEEPRCVYVLAVKLAKWLKNETI